MDACAVTDHGVMYGVVDFYRACKDAGIHPVIGCEVYVCPDMDEKQSAFREYSHLVLLCENNEGYKNLSRLVSEGFTRGFYYRPRVDYKLLEKYSGGLIALSACLSGDLPKLLLDGRDNEARQVAQKYLDIFGRGNFFVELQDHGIPEEKQVLPRLVKLAREMDIPLVVTNDCHYLTADDAEAQEVLMCIQTGKTLSDPNRMKMTTRQLYVKSEAEMRALFPNFPDAIENTAKIAARCNVEFDFSTTHLPKFPLPEGETDALAYLRALCEKGLKERYGEGREDARERMEYELGVISGMGYVDYFLIVWDFIHYARTHGVGVGPGRGSGAGSIVAYCLGITSIDPIQYNLLFERFLNPERVSMPDIDVDFDYERRGQVIDYVRRRYGQDHVAQIITFGTMAARAVIRDVGRVMDMSYQETDRIAKLVPFELGMTLERALSLSTELRRLYEGDDRVREVIDTAKKLEGMPRNASTHAAGVLITSEPVVNYVPLQTNDDVVTTQFPMGTLEALGLLKMDFLGLRTLNVIMDSIAMAVEAGAEPFKSEDIPLDDPGVYKMISEGDTDGVFQLESAGMKQFLTNMRPENFEDVIAAISLYRPGPMESIPRYIQGKHDPSSVRYETPLLEADPRRHLRLHGLSGTGDADRARSGRLFLWPQRSGAPRHGQEKARRHGQGKGNFHPRPGGKRPGGRARRGAQRRAGGCGRAHLRRDDRLCQLRLQQIPRRRLRPRRRADGVAEIALSRAVHGGADEQLLRQFRQGGLLHPDLPKARHPRAAAGREPFAGEVLRGGRGHPLWLCGREKPRPRGHPSHRCRARGGRAVSGTFLISASAWPARR